MNSALGSVQQQNELCDRIRAGLAEGIPALQPCLDRLVQPGLPALLALWKFRGRSSVVSAKSRLAQERDGNKLAQTHPDWKLESFCYWKQTVEHNSP